MKVVESNRINFRERKVDFTKPMQIMTDVNEVSKKEDINNLFSNNSNGHTSEKDCAKSVVESEIKKIIELFDKKKTIVIPRAEDVSKKSAPTVNTESGNFSTLNLAYKQTEFIRPKHLIVYSEKNRLEPKEKDYEASNSDLNFLNFEKYFISVEQLEKIISALENDINKGEMIPAERAKELIINIIPDKKDHVDKIYKYWSTRREEFKKSLLRKFWKDQKHTDKYIKTTFRRREKDKMKTRRNKKNEKEGLTKLKEIRDSTKKYLTELIKSMQERENLKKFYTELLQLEFESEINNMFKLDKPPIEKKIREFIDRCQFSKYKSPNKPIKSSVNIIEETNTTMETSHKIPYPSTNTRIKNMDNSMKDITNSHQNKTQKVNITQNINIQSNITGRTILPKRQKLKLHTNIEESLPKINEIMNLVEEDKKDTEISLIHRLRLNRTGKLVIDRYIKTPYSNNPFDDSFDAIYNKMKKYEEDLVGNDDNKKKFDNLFVQFMKKKYSGIDLISESEDEGTIFQNQLKNFNNSYKNFIKNKRIAPDN